MGTADFSKIMSMRKIIPNINADWFHTNLEFCGYNKMTIIIQYASKVDL